MRDTINAFLNEISRDRAKRRRMGAVVTALSLAVVIGVLWQMKITGITMTGEALCGYAEHVHSETCELVLSCGQEETPGHSHGEGCYSEDQVLICEQEEVPGHSHSEECYACAVEEHTHTVLCYSDREADLETEKVWKATLPELGDNYAENMVHVALSQVGCAESLRNFEVSPEGEQRGYSRYGAWYGNPYGNWSAMFASFCLHYAEHPAYETLKNSGPETMRLQAEAALCYVAREAYTPVAGDLVFLDRDGNGTAEAVAVVAALDGDVVTIVEGDYEDAVAKLTVEVSDPEILGWAVLSAPEAAEDDVAEGVDGDEPEEVGDADVKTIKVPAGKSVTELMGEDTAIEDRLPENPVPDDENEKFLGWFQGEVRLDDGTIFSEDATYVARFGVSDDVPAEYSVTIHDLVGTDSGAGNNMVIKVAPGQTLLEAFGERTMADGKAMKDCVWYADREKTGKLDLNAEVTGDLEIYTFSYRVQLIRNPAQATGVEIDGSGNLTLVLREGEKPRAEDFIVNGVDYRLYTWLDENRNEVDLNSIIANGVTRNITATPRGSEKDEYSCFRNANINFYVYVDNERVLVSHYNMMEVYSDTARWLIPASTLEAIYGEYGFEAEKMGAGTHYFPHTVRDSDTIWGDAPAKEFHGVLCAQTVGDDNSIDVYYLPAQSVTNSAGRNDPEMIAANTFYTIKVEDKDHAVYKEGESLPAEVLVFTGKEATVTLKKPAPESTYQWNLSPELGEGKYTIQDNGDTITYIFPNVTEPIRFNLDETNVTNRAYNITYSTSRDKIQGKDTFEETITVNSDGNVILKAPDHTEDFVSNASYNNVFTFEGWTVNGDENVVLPAGVVSGDEFIAAARTGPDVTLTAKWVDQKREGSCNFYVNLEFEIMNSGTDGGSKPVTNFTKSVYATKIDVNPRPGWFESTAVINGENSANASAIDQQIRQLPNGVKAHYVNQDRTFTLSSFPSDEGILAHVREQQRGFIANYEEWKKGQWKTDNAANDSVEAYRDVLQQRDDGSYEPKYRILWDGGENPVDPDTITSDNFIVRWYVLKYDSTDCWHVDGILVKKAGQLTVTKDFYGDQGAIDDVKQYFKISAEYLKNGVWTEFADMTTKGNSDNSTETTADSTEDTDNSVKHIPIKEASADGNSFTWILEAMPGAQVRLTEHDYISGTENIFSISEYMVDNEDEVARTGYVDSEGVVVTIRAYSVDTDYKSYKTVKFYNTYVPKGSVFINKIGSSSVPIPGVKFELHDGNDQQLTVYESAVGSYHLTRDEAGTWKETTELVTDEQGNIVIEILDVKHDLGQYSLKEIGTREGYNQIDEVKFTIDGDGKLTEVDEGGSVIKDDQGNNIGIKVVNDSKKIKVTVNKKWLDGTDKAVKVTLYRNNTDLTGKDKNNRPFQNCELNASNNWTVTWEDLPANVGGKPAVYSVRETWIGDVAYSGELAVNGGDGYKDYVVTYDKPQDVKGEDGKVTEIILGVNNQKDIGGFSFPKVDGETNHVLPGAEFKLYKDADRTVEYKTATSGDDGMVNFGSIPFGTYYMEETKAPKGYQLSKKTYKVTVGTNTLITEADKVETMDDGPVTEITNFPIYTQLWVKKVDENGKPLTDAQFELYKKRSSGTYVRVPDIQGNLIYSVDEDGKLFFSNLAGDYFLRETSAPAGYYRLTEDIYFSSANNTITLTKENPTGWKLEKNPDQMGDGSYVFTLTVTNVSGSELPSTGGMGTGLFCVLGFVLMMGAAVVFAARKRMGDS